MERSAYGIDILVENDQITILVESEEGSNNLNKLLAIRIMRTNHALYWSDINEYRSGLLIGSGTLNGKLYKILKSGMQISDNLARLYDYVEVLPAYVLVEDDISLEEWKEKTIELISFAERNGLRIVVASDTNNCKKR